MKFPSLLACALLLNTLAAHAADTVVAQLTLDLNYDGKPDTVRVLDTGIGDFNVLEISYSNWENDKIDVHSYKQVLRNARGTGISYEPFVVELKQVNDLNESPRLEIVSTQDEGTRGNQEKILIEPTFDGDGVLRIEESKYEHHAGDPSPSSSRIYDFEHQYSASEDDPGDRRDDKEIHARRMKNCTLTLKQYQAHGIPKCALPWGK